MKLFLQVIGGTAFVKRGCPQTSKLFTEEGRVKNEAVIFELLRASLFERCGDCGLEETEVKEPIKVLVIIQG